MPFSQKVRVIALAVIKHQGRIFLSQGYDPVKESTFYRAMGGGIKFGEYSLDGLKREFQEEINAELTNIKYLGCIENIFSYSGQQGHEIIQLYQCDFVDPEFYNRDRIDFSEGERQKVAVWVDLEQCKSGELRVVPEQFLDYI